MIRRGGIAGVLVLLVSLVGSIGPAAACAFHAWLPELTLVDRLLDADSIVLARPDPGDRLRFAAVETLPAVQPAADPVAPIPDLVDNVTFRRMQERPAESILFAHDPLDDVWRRLVDVDPALRRFVDRLLAEAPGWETPLDPGRFRIAADMLWHFDSTLAKLALLELDRAPYSTLVGLGLRPEAGRLLAGLHAPGDHLLEPIHVLLLGFSDDPRALRAVDATLARAATSTVAPAALGAYAVARIELGGAEGVDRLADLFLTGASAPDPGDARSSRGAQVVEALAIQAQTGRPMLRAHILGVLQEAAEARPDLVVPIARQFGLREDWGLSGAVEDAIRQRRIAIGPEMIAAANYVALARAAVDAGPAKSGNGSD